MTLDELYRLDKDFGEPRLVHLQKLLRPITWSWSSSIEGRRNLVYDRHREVNNAMPFMAEEEQEICREWKRRESHSGLWD